MKAIKFDICGQCPYFQHEQKVKIAGENFNRYDFSCKKSNVFFKKNTIIEDLFEIYNQKPPDWCKVPDDEEFIPVT